MDPSFFQNCSKKEAYNQITIFDKFWNENNTRHAQRRSQEMGTCKDMLSVATPESLVCCFKGKVWKEYGTVRYNA